jgi:hypothetical protein
MPFELFTGWSIPIGGSTLSGRYRYQPIDFRFQIHAEFVRVPARHQRFSEGPQRGDHLRQRHDDVVKISKPHFRVLSWSNRYFVLTTTPQCCNSFLGRRQNVCFAFKQTRVFDSDNFYRQSLRIRCLVGSLSTYRFLNVLCPPAIVSTCN